MDDKMKSLPCLKCDSCYYGYVRSYDGNLERCRKEDNIDSAYYKYRHRKILRPFPDCACYENKGEVERREAQEERKRQEEWERRQEEWEKEANTCPCCGMLVNNDIAFRICSHGKVFHKACYNNFISTDEGKNWDREQTKAEHEQINELKIKFAALLSSQVGEELLEKCPSEEMVSLYDVLQFYRNLARWDEKLKDKEKQINEFKSSNQKFLMSQRLQNVLQKYPIDGGYRISDRVILSNFDKNVHIIRDYLEIEKIMSDFHPFLSSDVGKKILSSAPSEECPINKMVEFYGKIPSWSKRYDEILSLIEKFKAENNSFFESSYCTEVIKKYPIDGGFDFTNGEISSNYEKNSNSLLDSIHLLNEIHRIKTDPQYQKYIHNFNIPSDDCVFKDLSDISDLKKQFDDIEEEIKKQILLEQEEIHNQILTKQKAVAKNEFIEKRIDDKNNKEIELKKIKKRHLLAKLLCLVVGALGWHYFVYGRFVIGILTPVIIAGISSVFIPKGEESFLPLWMMLSVWIVNCIITFSGNIKDKDGIKIRCKKKKIIDEINSIEKDLMINSEE